MKAVHFPENNLALGKEQNEYETLPALATTDQEGRGVTITCWKFSLWERLRILFGARMWYCQMNFTYKFHPVFFTTKKRNMIAK